MCELFCMVVGVNKVEFLTRIEKETKWVDSNGENVSFCMVHVLFS